MALSLTISNTAATPVTLISKSSSLGEVAPGSTFTFENIVGDVHLAKNDASPAHPDAFLGPAPIFRVTDLEDRKLPWHGPGPKPHWTEFPQGGTIYPVQPHPGLENGTNSNTFYYRYKAGAGLSVTVDEQFNVQAASISDSATGEPLGIYQPLDPFMSVYVMSAGYDDGNDAKIVVNNRDVFKEGLPDQATEPTIGMNVAIVDEKTATVLDVKSFNTYSASPDPFTKLLNDQPQGRLVIIAVENEASVRLDEDSKLAVERIGSQKIRDVGYCDSWLIIGQVGAPKGSVYEKLSPRQGGSTSKSVLEIPLPAVINTAATPTTQFNTLAQGCIDIHVEGHGIRDGNTSVIRVNDIDVFTLNFPGQPKEPGRGLNLAVIHEETGEVIDVKTFDTHQNSISFVSYLRGIRDGRVVLLAVMDEAVENLSKEGKAEIKRLGSTQIDSVEYRDSWALIGQKGAEPGTVYEEFKAISTGFVTLAASQVSLPVKINKDGKSLLGSISGQVLGEVSTPGSSITVDVESKGMEDGNDARIVVQGRDVFQLGNPGQATKPGTGMNVAEVDQASGNVLSVKVFDTHNQYSTNFTKFLNDLPTGRIVIVSVQDEAAAFLDEKFKLAAERLGSRFIRKLAYRDSWCIIGQVGAVIGTVPEVYTPKTTGTAALNTRVPLQTRVSHGISIKLHSGAYAYGNETKLWIDGKQNSRFTSENGMNVAVISPEGVVSQPNVYDTSKFTNADESFASWVDDLPYGTCVAMAIRYDAALKMSSRSRDAIRSLGGRLAGNIDFQESYAIIGFKGAAVGTVAEQYNASGPCQVVYDLVPDAVGGVAGINGQSEGFSISIESSGSSNKGFSRIAVDGEAVGLAIPGISLAVIDISSGIVLDTRSFNTSEKEEEANKLADYIEALTIGQLVALSVLKRATTKLTDRSKKAISSLGSRFVNEVGLDKSWVLFGRKGSSPGSVHEHYVADGNASLAFSTWFPVNGGSQDTYFDITVDNDPIGNEGSGGIIKVNDTSIGEKRTGLRIAIFDEATGAIGDNKSWDLYFYAEQAQILKGLINCRESCVVAISQHDDPNKTLPGTKYTGSDTSPVGSRPSWSFIGRVSDLTDVNSSPIVTNSKSPSRSFYRFFPTSTLSDIPATDVWLRSATGTESDVQMIINGKSVDVSSSSGMHVSVIDGANGEVTSSTTFDIDGDSAANDNFTNLIDSLDTFTLVAITVSGGVSDKLNDKSKLAIQGLGSRLVNDLPKGASWALVGSVGNVPSGAGESVLSNGPIAVSANMPYLKSKESDEDLVESPPFLRVYYNGIPSDSYYAQYLDNSSVARMSIKTPAVPNTSGNAAKRALLISSRTPSKTKPELGVSADRVISNQRRYLGNVEKFDASNIRLISRGEGQEVTKTRLLAELTEIAQKASTGDDVLISLVGYGVIESESAARHAIKVWDDDARTKQVLLYDSDMKAAFAKGNKNLKLSCLIQGRYDDIPPTAAPALAIPAKSSSEQVTDDDKTTTPSSEQLELRLRATSHCRHPTLPNNTFGKSVVDISPFLKCEDGRQ